MAIKLKLEKDGQLKNAFVGFSWTTFIFGFWVPLFRGRFKDFFYFFVFFICKIVISAVLVKEMFDMISIGIRESRLEVSYYIIIPFILMMALYPIDIFWLILTINIPQLICLKKVSILWKMMNMQLEF